MLQSVKIIFTGFIKFIKVVIPWSNLFEGIEIEIRGLDLKGHLGTSSASLAVEFEENEGIEGLGNLIDRLISKTRLKVSDCTLSLNE